MTQLGLLTAVILLMAFTPIGYIKTLGLEISLIVIPVTIGAILLGPAGGAVLGGVFGITSFIQCFGMSAFGAVLLSINPGSTFILCIIPRILMGWVTGLVYVNIRKHDRKGYASHMITCLVGPLSNTIFFMSALLLFFYNTEYIQGVATELGTNNILAFAIAFVGINGLVEAIACLVIGSAISKSLEVALR